MPKPGTVSSPILSSTSTSTSFSSPSSSREFPRNIYSFSSEKARRDLKSQSKSQSHSSSKSQSRGHSISSITSQIDLDQQIEIFEQQNLFGPEFDVIEELLLNKERYIAYGGPQRIQLTVYGIPSVVSYNIERIAQKLKSDKIGAQSIISCCASFGVAQLYKDPHIRDLANYREQFLEDHDINNGRDVIEFYDLLRTFKIDIPDDSGGLSARGKSTILIPEWLAQNLGGLASRLGAPASSLLIICVMFTLATQSTVIESHKKQLSSAIETFLRRVEFRKRVASLLLEMLER